MTEKEIVLETIRALPDDCSLEEIAERIEFMASVQKGLDQPHGLQTNLVFRCKIVNCMVFVCGRYYMKYRSMSAAM